MSTATLSAPHLEVTAPDNMGLHSEDGLDFDDDVDIDLDLRSAGGVDDDVSLRDAGTDGDQDMQAVSGDLDDFMADNEDLIDEDIVDEDIDLDLHPPSAERTTALDQSPSAGPEEDLIDYSDDEDSAVDGKTVTANAPPTDTLEEPAIVLDKGDQGGADSQSSHRSHAEVDVTESTQVMNAQQAQTDLDTLQNQDLQTAENPSDTSVQPDEQSRPTLHDDFQTSGEETHSPERGTSDAIDFSTATGIENPSTEQDGQASKGSNLHPVNVHFNGKDYWLFLQHDYEGSGDYLLDDESYLKQPLNSVINACREALSTLEVDVPSDLELGFCLDSLHQVELFEDHSTCAFFSLDDILRVYLQLYAQDGINDPEYFCISLVSRPRVSSLLAELSRAATEGIGYSGLDNIIASGQSLFSIQKPHSPTEHGYGEWEGEDVQEAPKVQQPPKAETQDEHNGEHQEDHDHEYVHGLYEEQGPGDNDWQQDGNNKHEPELESETTADIIKDQAPAAGTASGSDIPRDNMASVKEASEQAVPSTALSEQTLQDPEVNFIDYSDEEYEEDTPGDQAQASRVSSTSATVQGDDPLQGYEENVAQDNHQGVDPVEDLNDGQAGSGVDPLAEFEGNDYSYEEFGGEAYGEAYEEEYEQEYNEDQEAEVFPDYGVAQANFEDTNYYGDPEQQVADDADDLDVTAEFHLGESDAAEDVFEGENDFPESGDTAAIPDTTVNHDAAEDELDYSDDEEDGVVSQALAAASSAADTVVTSSTEPRALSPQGQKRTIDEVGNDVVDSTTSTDAKRPRV